MTTGDCGLSEQGQKVAAVPIFSGIGIFTNATSQIVQSIADALSRRHAGPRRAGESAGGVAKSPGAVV